MESMSPFSPSVGALYRANRRIKSMYWPWISPYTFIGARSLSSISSFCRSSRTWSQSVDTSLACSKNRFGSGSGCQVVGCNKFSMMKLHTPEAAPPLSRSVATLAITLEGWILRPSSSNDSMATLRTRCVKSFSRLTNTCGDIRMSPDTSAAIAEDAVAGASGRLRGGVAGLRPEEGALGIEAEVRLGTPGPPESLLGAWPPAVYDPITPRSAVLGAEAPPTLPSAGGGMGSSSLASGSSASSVLILVPVEAARARSKSKTCRSDVGAEGLLWSKPP
mmetsp:Transcript_148423/g.273861  ORF Transcript_148423/g.273861 Transcript_148423/m.273861 type:complete len:277 (+) Transcript_148423:852-1682(+)